MTTKWYGSLRSQVFDWMSATWSKAVANNKTIRNHRFLEESLELVQACGMQPEEVRQIVNYVFSRPIGVIPQEVGGVRITLEALCLAWGIDSEECAEKEISRCWDNIEKIREKDSNKPKFSGIGVDEQIISLYGAVELKENVEIEIKFNADINKNLYGNLASAFITGKPIMINGYTVFVTNKIMQDMFGESIAVFTIVRRTQNRQR